MERKVIMQTASDVDTMDEELRSHLQDLAYGDFQNRWVSLKKLVKWGDMAIQPLLELLQDEALDWEVHWFAARGLSEFDRPEVIDALLQMLISAEEEVLQAAAAEALSQIGAPAIAALSGQLHHRQHHALAALALTRIYHPTAIPHLLELTADPNANIREQAVNALSPFCSPEIEPHLIRALTDPAAAVRIAAIKGLSRHHQQLDTLTLNRFQACLKDENNQVAAAAMAALSRVSSSQVVNIISGVLTDAAASQSRRAMAARTLGWIESPAALRALIKAWDHSNLELRLAIINALGNQPAALASQATQALLVWLPQLQNAPEAEKLLQELALALGRLRDDRAADILEELSHHQHPGVRLHSQAGRRQLTS